MSPGAVHHALKHAWLALQPLDLPVAVMGGLAMAAWKCLRATRDVDLLLGVALDDVGPVLQVLADAEIRPKREPPAIPLGRWHVVQLLYEPPESFVDLQIDLLLADSPYHREALRRRVPTWLPDLDVAIHVLACEDLILHKLLAARIIDRADAAALLRANRDTLDKDYLLRWTAAEKLLAELSEVWEEAWPGEPLPIE